MDATVADLNPNTLENAKRQFVELYGSALVMNTYLKIALVLVSLVALGISYGTFVLLTQLFPDVAPQVHQLIGIVPATAVNYFLNSYWTFREDREQRSK